MNMRNLAGFTLMELMIVVTIVGVLAAIAYPSYNRWAIEARRSDAHIALTKTAADLEKFFAECSEYTSSFTSSRSCSAKGLGYSDNFSPEKYYSLAITLSGASFTLTATPRAGMAQVNDKNCTTLTLTSKGAKNATGTETSRCWRK
jgi:type IV pilus assembly protein PilE